MTGGQDAARAASEDQIALVVARVEAELDVDVLRRPATYGYPNSLALCVIDSIQSTGVQYPSVEKVIGRYRAYRGRRGADAERDDLALLLDTFTALGGPDGWARLIGNGHRTSTRSGAPLKAAAVHRAAQSLLDAGVDTTEDLRDAVADHRREPEIRSAWLGVPGQSSGVTWHYVLMLAGVPGVKPDRMIKRFVGGALALRQGAISEELARTAVVAAAAELGVSATDLDHAMWRSQRRRG